MGVSRASAKLEQHTTSKDVGCIPCSHSSKQGACYDCALHSQHDTRPVQALTSVRSLSHTMVLQVVYNHQLMNEQKCPLQQHARQVAITKPQPSCSSWAGLVSLAVTHQLGSMR